MAEHGYEMACFHPLSAFKTNQGQIIFTDKFGGDPITLPCGQCIGCRLERSRQWAMRITHEASMHPQNCFITLTYDPENLPPDGSLRVKDFQNFMKKLRREHKQKIRFYQCGEYGENGKSEYLGRPHYHAILFNVSFFDAIYLFDSPGGEAIYTSPALEKIWGKGFVTVGTVTFESAGYVARYCMKKLNGPLKEQINVKTGLKPYERNHDHTGEIIQVKSEYSTMSRRPGIGHNWISTYTRDVYPKDFTTIKGMRLAPPKYYDKYLQGIDPDLYDDIKSGRELSAYHSTENTRKRLAAKETVKKAQFKQLIRSL